MENPIVQSYNSTIIKVVRKEDLYEQIGKDIFFDLVDHEKVSKFIVHNQMPFRQFKEEVAKSFGVQLAFQRFWLWVYRDNNTYRPDRPLTNQEETKSVGQLMEVLDKAHHKELILFLDELGPDLRPVFLPGILLFFKLYDPIREELRYVGKLIVKGTDKPVDISKELNKMAGFALDEDIQLYEEIRFEPKVRCDCIDKKITFHANELEDGDIICFQKLSPVQSSYSNLTDLPSFLEYNHQLSSFRRFVGTVENQPVEGPSSARLTWTIENFSKLDTGKLYSDIFVVGGYNWRVLIYPKGNNVNDLSLYLHAVDWSNLPYVQFSLSVVDHRYNRYTVRKDAQHQFNANEKDVGFQSFMGLNELHNRGQGHLVNDTCVIEAMVDVSTQSRERKVAVHRVIYNLKYNAKKAPYDMPTIENDLPSCSIPLQINAPPMTDELKVPAPTTQSGENTLPPEYPNSGQQYEAEKHCQKGVLQLVRDAKFENIGGFSILKQHALLYKHIWLKYGHIASSQVLIASYPSQVILVTELMNCIMVMYRCRLSEVSSTLIELWEDKIKMAEKLEFNIRWLQERFENVKKDFYGWKKLRTTLQEQDLVSLTEAKARVMEAKDKLKKVGLMEVKDELKMAVANLSALETRISPLLVEKQMYIEKGRRLLLDGLL